jgi:DNA-binding transcriptional LysR family regulator
MDELKPYAVFAEAVAAGSMSAAARRLGMSPSAVSQTIRALEQHAGVTLLHRSTRKLALTEAGERCYPHCRRLIEAARAAADSLAQARDAPTGDLRVAAPVGFGAHIASALAPVLAEWPQLRLRLLVDDALIDLIDARVDIAIRVGRLADSNWIARHLCEFEMILCAAPTYVERHGAPSALHDLPSHHWLALARDTVDVPQDDATPAAERLPSLALDLHGTTGERQRVHVGVRIASNNQLALQQMCEQGLGIARFSHADVLPSLDRGTLVRLLAHWRFTPMPVRAITPRRDGEPAKVRVAVEALKRYFATLPGIAPVKLASDLSS